jgi:hypothetical protein
LGPILVDNFDGHNFMGTVFTGLVVVFFADNADVTIKNALYLVA